MATQYAETGCAQAEKDRIDGLYFAAISLFFVEQGPKHIRKQCFFVDGVRLSQIGFVVTGALSRGCGSHLGFPT
jgi:hypothetical protein